jgi:hypothetical protein
MVIDAATCDGHAFEVGVGVRRRPDGKIGCHGLPFRRIGSGLCRDVVSLGGSSFLSNAISRGVARTPVGRRLTSRDLLSAHLRHDFA